jgi:hypothetical protein
MTSLLLGWLQADSVWTRVRRTRAPKPARWPDVRRRSFVPCLELLEERNLLASNTSTAVADTGIGTSLLTELGPLVQVSSTSPFEGSTADNIPGQPGTNYLDTEVEPSMTADPLNPKHFVGAWQQDRWSGGGARDIVTGVSYDGGKTWTLTPVPGATLVAGGVFQRASDPWVSFAPDGGVYLAVYAFDATDSHQAMLVYKSTDGGLTWGEPTTLLFDSAGNVTDDKESVTTDRNDPHFAYYTWDRLFFDPSSHAFVDGPAYFSRTTDGGLTWEPARVIYGDIPDTQTIGNQIVVTPDGTLLDLFTFYDGSGSHAEVIRSTDHGETWSNPITVAAQLPIGVSDPSNGFPLRTGAGLPAIAVDPRNGTLYVVWEDARFSGYAYDSVALSLSTDDGLTWSAPIQVNQTPTSIPAGRRQAFTPSVAVAPNGNVAVTYYDLRNPDNQAAGLPTDYWIVFGRGNQDLTNPNNWQSEQRLTKASFNMQLAPIAGGYFLGDYMGLTAGGESRNSFAALFGQTVSSSDRASIFFHDPAPDESTPVIMPSEEQPKATAGAHAPQTPATPTVDGTDPRPSTLALPEVPRLNELLAAKDNSKMPVVSLRSRRWLADWFASEAEVTASLTASLGDTPMAPLLRRTGRV